jgi:ribonuclease Z
MPSRKRRLPFRYIEPACFGGLLDDPLLFVRIRPLGRALLFDCGQIAHLAKRVVKPIDTLFITHAHMDHIMGVPTLVRHHHASPRPLDIFGPPGIIERIGHQLGGYDWNLSEPTWFTLRVHEVHREGIRHVSFIGPRGFQCRCDGEEPRRDRVIWTCRYVSVEAEQLDHKLPVLAFRLRERPHFAIDHERLARRGLAAGTWIGDLKRRVWQGRTDAPVLPLYPGSVSPEAAPDPQALYESIRADLPAASLGYLCDVGWTAENIATMEPFLAGLTLLCSDCTFLAADVAKARISYHLCTTDLNELARRLSPLYLLPMHLSKSYLYRTADLYGELHPPAGTTVLPLPDHIVPPPLTARDVSAWLRPPDAA